MSGSNSTTVTITYVITGILPSWVLQHGPHDKKNPDVAEDESVGCAPDQSLAIRLEPLDRSIPIGPKNLVAEISERLEDVARASFVASQYDREFAGSVQALADSENSAGPEYPPLDSLLP